jgi:hypothetical protein
MSDERTIATIQRGENSQVRVNIQSWDDRQYVHVRLYVRDDEGEEYHPTKKGIMLRIDQAQELIDGIKALEGELVEAGHGKG